MGRTGRVTPRATLKAVQISGSTVRYATLHNADFITNLDVRVGAKVIISKRGEIIPAIEEVLARGDAPLYVFPKSCPACQSTLNRVENMADWMCLYPMCPEKALNRIIFFAGRKQMDILGLGEALCKILYDKKFVTSIPDIYKLYAKKQDLEQLEGFGSRSVELLLTGIEESKGRNFRTLLASLGLREIGPKVCEILWQAGYDSYEKIEQLARQARQWQSSPQSTQEPQTKSEPNEHKNKVKQKQIWEEEKRSIMEVADGQNPKKSKKKKQHKAPYPALAELHGIGPRTTAAIIEQFNDLNVQSLFAQLGKAGLKLSCGKKDREEPKMQEQAIFAGQIWCITGSLEHFKARELAMAELTKRGAKITSTLNKSTTHLLVGAKAGSKLNKAKALGSQVLIVSEQQFLESLASHTNVSP